jgi:hypothetical protein
MGIEERLAVKPTRKVFYIDTSNATKEEAIEIIRKKMKEYREK